MRVLVTGGAGLLGRHLIKSAPDENVVMATRHRTPVDHAHVVTVDLAREQDVARLFERVHPEVVVHTAYTMNSERDIVRATENVARSCKATGAALVHVSSDALFDGLRAPYAESDNPSPMTDYGRWKAEAEGIVQHLLPDAAIVRTSLITQFRPLDPRSAWVANSLRKRVPITLFVDELRCPVAPDDLAAQIWELVALEASKRKGVWHLVGTEAISRYALGLLIAAHEGYDPSGITAAYTDPTLRPRDLRLSTARADAQLSTRARPISTLAYR